MYMNFWSPWVGCTSPEPSLRIRPTYTLHSSCLVVSSAFLRQCYTASHVALGLPFCTHAIHTHCTVQWGKAHQQCNGNPSDKTKFSRGTSTHGSVTKSMIYTRYQRITLAQLADASATHISMYNSPMHASPTRHAFQWSAEASIQGPKRCSWRENISFIRDTK